MKQNITGLLFYVLLTEKYKINYLFPHNFESHVIFDNATSWVDLIGRCGEGDRAHLPMICFAEDDDDNKTCPKMICMLKCYYLLTFERFAY